MATKVAAEFVQVEGERELTHLSHSRISRYLHCPEQYRLYYIEGLRPSLPSASLEFGQCIHRSLAAFFHTDESPMRVFEEQWYAAREEELRYAYRESWATLAERGQRLLSKFMLEELPRITCFNASEKPFQLAVSSLDVPFVGVIDLVARVDGVESVVDFKTAAAAYQEHEVQLSDQLTAYQLAQPQAKQSALCVFVKTKEPRIEWFFANRTGLDLREYLGKVSLVGQQIAAGQFFKRPGKWCSYCDFLAVCMGGRKRTEETLVKRS